ncbi:glutamate-cysteine ligase family protein [Saccharothrix syringae]|uniref:glutamate-cysteine ligase family protein n=1 Tax=Saccharothrix syringae TaxID=103733 RepID=UPI0006913D25|nr:glutamate-cysteine ligase family protein [Saccharothrix syringae]
MPGSTAPVERRDLEGVFAKPPGAAERVGLETEIAAVDPVTGDSRPYHGERGVRALLDAVLGVGGWHPVRHGADLVALTRDDGAQITLEPGGAVEYGSAPHGDLVTLLDRTRRDLAALAGCAARVGIALVPGANYPFTGISGAKWAPKPHSEIVRDHLARIGAGGAWGPHVMALTLSTQVTLDYTGPADLARKLRAQVAASTAAAALFVNSPLEAGRPTGLLSRRMRYWTRHDPRRTGVLAPALAEGFTAADFVDWALALRMIYRRDRAGRYVPAPDRPFAVLLDEGFGDGTAPDLADWLLHLSQIWTDVRLRRTLELRAVDGPPHAALGAVPAFWVGLTYDASSCADAWELLRRHTAADHRALVDDVAARGLRARLAGTPVAEVAAELLRLARRGLAARVDRGLEHPSATALLEPLEEVAATGTTFAEQCLRRWSGEFHESPERYVRAYRIPVDHECVPGRLLR